MGICYSSVASRLPTCFASWFNIHLFPRRPTWAAEAEYSYYKVDRAVLQQHRDRQAGYAREAYFSGLRIVRALDLLSTATLDGAAVLDIGAGECLVSAAVARLGASEVWALDAVPKQIWAAAEHHHADSRLNFVIADATDSPFAEHSFDVVVANLVLHHVEPMESLASEVFRVLRPGGLFAAFEPNPVVEGVVDLLTRKATSPNEGPITRKRIAKALHGAGFASISFDYWWSRLETSRFRWVSPGFRVRATKPDGGSEKATGVQLRRGLSPMALPGLKIDTGCRFADLALGQERQMLDLLPSLV